jgi:hypothetical protein
LQARLTLGGFWQRIDAVQADRDRSPDGVSCGPTRLILVAARKPFGSKAFAMNSMFYFGDARWMARPDRQQLWGLALGRPSARLHLATRYACLEDPALRATVALLVVVQGVVNPQELLPCIRCGLATCGWCEACGPLWTSRNPAEDGRPAFPICYMCDCEQRVCPECEEVGFTWAGARREYHGIYPEIYRFKVGGTWQAHVAEMERSWIRRQFGSSAWWCPQVRTQAALPASRDDGQDVTMTAEHDVLDEPDLDSTGSESMDVTPFPAEGVQYRSFAMGSADVAGRATWAASPSSEASRQGPALCDFEDDESLRSPPGVASSVASTTHTLLAQPPPGQANDVWL